MSGISLNYFLTVVLRQSLSLELPDSVCLYWLAASPRSLVSLPTPGMISMCCHAMPVTWVLGSELRPSCLHGKCLTGSQFAYHLLVHSPPFRFLSVLGYNKCNFIITPNKSILTVNIIYDGLFPVFYNGLNSVISQLVFFSQTPSQSGHYIWGVSKSIWDSVKSVFCPCDKGLRERTWQEEEFLWLHFRGLNLGWLQPALKPHVGKMWRDDTHLTVKRLQRCIPVTYLPQPASQVTSSAVSPSLMIPSSQ